MLTSRRKDGDAIVAALLHCPGCRINLTSSAEIDGIPSAALTYFQGKLSAEVAFRLLLLLEGDRDGQTLLPVRCSSKGYTLLATHIQRSLRRLHEVPLSPNQEQGQTDRLRLRQVAIASLRSSRERLFDALRADLLQERRQREAADRSGLLATSLGDAGEVALPQAQSRGSQRQQQEEGEGQLELNGRLVDALVIKLELTCCPLFTALIACLSALNRVRSAASCAARWRKPRHSGSGVCSLFCC